MGEQDTALRALLRQRHMSYGAFCREWDRVAKSTDEAALIGHYPGRAQYYRWLRGELTNKRPYPDACRMLEAMFPGWSVERLFSPYTGENPPDLLWFSRMGSGQVHGHDNSEMLQAKEWYPLAGSPETRTWAAGRDTLSPETELSTMLTDYGFNPDRFGSVPRDDIPLADLERDVRIVFDAYQQSRFTTAASRLSTLLADAQLVSRECSDADRHRALRVLALSYQAAASVLTKVGEADLAWIAAERGLNAADGSGSPPVRGSLIRSVAFALHSTGRFDAAMTLVDASADAIYEEIAGSGAMMSVYGTLLLVGSMAAARFGDGSRTADYLRQAGSAAQRLGRDENYLWTSFGPTNVAIHRVNTAVELDNFQAVLDSGLSLNTDAVPVERRVRYQLDVARAYAMTGNRDDALSTILAAERIAPEQVRQHYVTRNVVTTLIQGVTGKPTPELHKLATRVRVRDER